MSDRRGTKLALERNFQTELANTAPAALEEADLGYKLPTSPSCTFLMPYNSCFCITREKLEGAVPLLAHGRKDPVFAADTMTRTIRTSSSFASYMLATCLRPVFVRPPSYKEGFRARLFYAAVVV